MAAEATRIKLKRSTTASVLPTTSNLADGEVAVNVADRKIFVRNGQTVVEVANQKPATGEVTAAMFATDITNGPGNTYYVASTGSNANTLASSGANGLHPDTPFLTIEKALSVATSGDIVNIAAGTFQEVFPLTVPDGVTVKGANLRSTQITPTSGTNDLNAFILSGDVHISDLTVKDFFYNSSNDTGYGFVCASSLDSDRSPYLERVTVLTKGSVTSGTDPYGFAQGDAGRGAKLDGALFAASGLEAAILFNEVTFIVPNSVGLLLTNGVRVEWLNSFIYFANEGIKGVQGATGRSGSGQTRLKLSGVSGTFSTSEIIYQLEDSFKSGTYARSGTTVTVTRAAHGMSNGDVVYADFISGSGTDNYYTIANVATDTFELTDSSSGTTSGNVTYKKATAYGTVTTNDGTYILINGKGTGEFVTGVPIAKTGVVGGDAKLDTAQKKFGTASLELDGTADNLTYPTSTDFGFGTTNWAAECFIRPSSVTGTQYIFDFRNASATDTAPTVYLSGTALHFGVGNTSQATGGTLSTGTWYHVAVARSGGSTKLFLNGTQVGSTYTDTNNYGTTKPLAIGSDYNSAANAFAGHIDEVRVSKASARYTANFTSTTTAFGNDLNTVLLIHFDGTDASTTITDSSGGVKDIRSSGGDSATSILTADYAQFGAELRGISSANIYGTKGAIADGAGVKILLTAHNFAYVGSGADFTNDPSLAVPANEVTETNGGRIFYSATNQNGDFRVGDAFVVDQATGNVQFQSTSTSQEAANITLSDATGTTKIFPAFVETGNLRLSGNTVSSTSGSVIIDPSANEDITLNAETIIPEQLYFDSTKIAGLSSDIVGNVKFNVNNNEQGGFSSYGVYSLKNFTVNSDGIATVSIDTEGTDYTAGTVNLNVVSSPSDAATATATLDTTNGSVKTITLSNNGSLYQSTPDIVLASAPGSGITATGTATLSSYGVVAAISVSAGGAGYTSPTLTFADAPKFFFETGTAVDSTNDTITQTTHPFSNGDQLIYGNEGGSQNVGLTDGTTYYVVSATTNTFKLSATSGGSAINLTSGGTETHSLRGLTATASATVSAGAITAISITSAGTFYTTAPALTITDAGATTPAAATVLVGYPLSGITIAGGGSGYTSAPSVTITPQSADTTGTGAAASTTIGFPVGSVTLTNPGSTYSIAPTAIVSGGSPVTDATFETTLNKKTGRVDSITVTDGGDRYSTAPTITLIGGAGEGGILNASIAPFAGTITVGGSGYSPGVYATVPLIGAANTGETGFVAATATITVVGLTGSISTAGSGYTNGTYTSAPIRNNPTTTYTIASVNREILQFRYSASSDYAWDVTNNGASAYTFTRTSSTGTASGDNISITAEVGDILTFNVNASGHPMSIQTTSGAYDGGSEVTGSDITNNGTASGTITWDLKNVAPGTYYYVCQNHSVMAGTITVSAFSGSTYSVSDTITGGTSGASGVVTSVGDYLVRFATVSSGPFQNGESITNGSVTATTIALDAQTNVDVFTVNGTEAAPITLLTHNTYKFDTSSTSLTLFSLGGFTSGNQYNSTDVGSIGNSGAFTEFVITDQATASTATLYYGAVPTSGNYITVNNGSGSQGVYGTGAAANVTVSSGAVSAFELTNQGTGYKVSDVISVAPSSIGGTGSGFEYTINSVNTSISSVTNVSSTGGPYLTTDVLSVDPSFDGVGSGSGFQFSVSKVGFIESIAVAEAGFGFAAGESLGVTPETLPTTSGTAFALSVGTVAQITPIEVKYDGGIVSQKWSIDKNGNATLGTSSALSTGSIASTTITNTAALTTQSLTTSANASVGGSLTITGSLIANGTSNAIADADIQLQDGSAAAPSLKLTNSNTTGLYRDAANTLGISASGIARVKIGAADIETTNNIKLDSAFGAPTPFLSIDATAETVSIGAPETGIKINNDASIESIGNNPNVDIAVSPKGTGNVIITGGTDQDFSITDGSTETFRVDTDSGDATVGGKLDVNGNVRIQDNIISSAIAQTATTSFGQIITVSATNTATGYTDGTYTAVTSTSNLNGTGATFNVTVSGGDITAIAVNAGGSGSVSYTHLRAHET